VKNGGERKIDRGIFSSCLFCSIGMWPLKNRSQWCGQGTMLFPQIVFSGRGMPFPQMISGRGMGASGVVQAECGGKGDTVAKLILRKNH